MSVWSRNFRNGRFIRPRRNGGSEITEYEYTLNGGQTWSAFSPASTSRILSVTGLENGNTYSIQVRAVNGAGGGAASNARTFTPRTVASAPVITSLNAQSNSIEVNFNAPVNNGGSDVIRYSCSINGQKWRFCFEDTTSPQMISGLKNGVSYSIRIRAQNASGWSVSSTTVEATPQR